MSDPVAGPIETADRVALSTAIAALGITLEISLETPIPSGASVPVGVVLVTNSIINIVPAGPFEKSKLKWEDIASDLDDLKSDLSSKNENVSGSWEGPGAEAFDDYLTNKILPTLDTLAIAARHAGEACAAIAFDVKGGLAFFIYSSVASIWAAYYANSLLAVPFVGPELVAAAKWIVGTTWIVLTIWDISLMISTIMMNVEQTRALEADYNNLVEIFGEESDRLDREALERDRAEVADVMADTGGWNKP